MKIKKVLITIVIILVLLLGLGVATWKIMNSRTFQFFGGIVNRIDTKEKVVALTFDDGPTKEVDNILAILNSEKVKATFFLIGSEIKANQEETKKLISAGEEIGNHTYSHNRMVFKSYAFVKREIEETDKLIEEMGYQEPIQFRSPYCKKLIILPYYLKQHQRKNIIWDLEPNSYPEINASSKNIIKYVVDYTKPGSIILLHPWYDKTGNSIRTIKGIIQGLKAKGYSFKTINELLEMGKSK